MEEMFKFREFSEKIAGGLEKDRMMKDIEAFSHLERYTGSREGEQAAEMIAARMESLGIPVSREIYRIYRSLPGKAAVKVLGQGIKEEIALTPYVYSGQAESVQAELVFDEFSVTGCTQKQRKERMKAFAGKIVLTYESSFSFA